MPKLSAAKQKILKLVHVLFATIWVGGAVAWLLAEIAAMLAEPELVAGIMEAAHYIHLYQVIIIGALGCLGTGLIYSIFTKWGFSRHRWIILKWLLFIAIIIIGCCTPWLEENRLLLQELGTDALSLPVFTRNARWGIIWICVQVAMILAMLPVSFYKPKLGKTAK